MRDTDQRALLDIACRIVRDDPYQAELANRVANLLRTDAGTALAYYSLRAGCSSSITVAEGAPLTDSQIELRRQAAPRHPGWNSSRSGKSRPVVRLSDLINLRRFWGTELYQLFHGQEQGRYPANVLLQMTPHEITFLALQRRTRDFSDVDMSDMTMIQHVLTSAFELKDALSRLHLFSSSDETPLQTCQAPLPSNASRRTSGVRLTSRQAEALALAAAGWTNQRIARLLGITERTVRKHLSDVYERTGTSGRVEAATWYQRNEEH